MPIPMNYPINYLSTCLMIRDCIVASGGMPEISISRLITELRVSLGISQELFAVELERSELSQLFLTSYVRLYKALGGGWLSEEQMLRADDEANHDSTTRP